MGPEDFGGSDRDSHYTATREGLRAIVDSIKDAVDADVRITHSVKCAGEPRKVPRGVFSAG